LPLPQLEAIIGLWLAGFL